MTMTASPSVSGRSITLGNIQQQAAVPGSIFVAGYNLFIIDDGDIVPGTAQTVIEGSNTVQGVQPTAPASISVGPIDITDPDAMRGTGDETATPAPLNAAYPDQTWTAKSGAPLVEFREDTVTPLTPDVGGLMLIANIPTMGAPLVVRFGCSPGTVTGPDPGTFAFIDPAPAFASASIATGRRAAALKKCKKKKGKKRKKCIKKAKKLPV